MSKWLSPRARELVRRRKAELLRGSAWRDERINQTEGGSILRLSSEKKEYRPTHMATQTTATAQAALAIAAAQAAFAAGTAAAAPPVVDLATEDAARAQAEEASVGSTSTEIFTNYAPSHSSVPGGPHPGDVAEAASLAATDAPACTYELAPVLIDGGHLSNLQLECIQLAATRHLSVVPTQPTPTRCGFFLGDGAGVGKGRQLAGIILDQLSRGSKRHVWFSISSDLRTDAERDLHDLGCFVGVHDGCQGLDKSNKGFGLAKDAQSGVLFSTYAFAPSWLADGCEHHLAIVEQLRGGVLHRPISFRRP